MDNNTRHDYFIPKYSSSFQLHLYSPTTLDTNLSYYAKRPAQTKHLDNKPPFSDWR